MLRSTIPHRMDIILSIRNYTEFNVNTSFLQPNAHVMLVIQKCPKMAQPLDVSHNDFASTVYAQHRFVLVRRPILDDLHGIRPGAKIYHP